MSPLNLSRANAEQQQELSANLSSVETIESVVDLLQSTSNGTSLRDLMLISLMQLSQILKKSEVSEDQSAAVHELELLFAGGLRAQSSNGSISTDPTTDYESQALTAEVALAGLDLLVSSWSHPINERTLVAITAYTTPTDPWTTNEAADTASTILAQSLNQEQPTNLIISSILQSCLRPIFARTSNKVTESGRPSYFQEHDPNARRGLEPPSWKKQGLHVVSIFRWTVESSSEDIVRDNWPLFTPVLLALLEDEETRTRIMGLNILVLFLDKCPSRVLQSTGIGTIFQEVVFPSLLFLPSLTPEKESIAIMQPAYKVLIRLAEKEHDPRSPSRRQLLDKVLRDGILTAFDHSSQYAGVVEALMEALTLVLGSLGIFSTKHLQKLLLMLSAIMTDPFMISQLPVIIAANKALKATIASCWPRICDGGYDGEIIRIIAVCWLNLSDSQSASQLASEDINLLTKELKTTAEMLDSLRQSRGLKQSHEVDQILKQEPQLARLFPID